MQPAPKLTEVTGTGAQDALTPDRITRLLDQAAAESLQLSGITAERVKKLMDDCIALSRLSSLPETIRTVYGDLASALETHWKALMVFAERNRRP